MSDKNLTQFPQATSLLANDDFHINQGGVDKRIPASTVLASISGGSPFDVIPVEENNTARTITLADKDKFIQCLNSSGCVVTLPSDSVAPFDIGEQVTVKNDSIGTVTFVAGAGVTIRQSSIGLAMPTQGQAATFVKVAADTWNMISGGGGQTGTQRFKVTRDADFPLVGSGSASFVQDPQLTVGGLTEGATYKVDCILGFNVTTSGPATVLYQVSPTNLVGNLPLTDFLTHSSQYDGLTATINNNWGDTPAQQAITNASSGEMSSRITGEVTIPSGGSEISVRWSPVENGESIALREGSTLVVEAI